MVRCGCWTGEYLLTVLSLMPVSSTICMTVLPCAWSSPIVSATCIIRGLPRVRLTTWSRCAIASMRSCSGAGCSWNAARARRAASVRAAICGCRGCFSVTCRFLQWGRCTHSLSVVASIRLDCGVKMVRRKWIRLAALSHDSPRLDCICPRFQAVHAELRPQG